MATKYKIDFTDQNPNRSFQIREYTSNGTENPTSNVLSSTATAAATSLLLYGKGHPNYGEGTAENLVHLLENFASVDEPTNPIPGQIWYDRASGPDGQLRVYNSTSKELTNITQITATESEISVEGDVTPRYSTFVGSQITITDTTSDPAGELYNKHTLVSITFDGTYTKMTVSPQVSTPPSGKFIGGWDDISQSNIVTDIDLLGTHYLISPADPTDDSHVGDRGYNDIRYVNASGDTMVGYLTLNGPPVDPLHAATKQYTEDYTNNAIATQTVPAGTAVLKTDPAVQTMVGPLELFGNPTANLHAAPKQYVDTTVAAAVAAGAPPLNGLTDVTITSPSVNDILIYDFGSGQWVNSSITNAGILKLSGGTMTGQLTLNGPPVAALDAVPSSHLEQRLSDVTGGLLSVVQSGTFAGDTITFQRTDGSTFDVTGINTSGNGDTFTVNHISNPPFQNSITGDQIQETFWSFPNFPSVTLDDVIETFSEILFLTRQKNERAVFTATGAATYSNIPEYACGMNNLQVFVNGVKYIASDRGYQIIDPGVPVGPQNAAGFHHGITTGLSNDATVYTMNVTVDGGAPITVDVTGSAAQTFGALLVEINADLGAAAKATIEDEKIIIYSATSGAGSSVSITDVDLISNLTGESTSPYTTWNSTTAYFPGDIVNRSGIYFIALRPGTNFDPLTNPKYWKEAMIYLPTLGPSASGVTYSYSEDGNYATTSTSITFDPSSIPVPGATIECIVIGQQRQYGR